jgi:uncharacterized GH25 family protein
MATSFVNTVLKVRSGQSIDVTVQVRDQEGMPVDSADMMVKVDRGTDAAKLAVKDGYQGSTDGITITGRTDANGYFKARLETVAGLNETHNVTLSAFAMKTGYDQRTTTSQDIEVNPSNVQFITIDMFLVDPDNINAGDTSTITLRVVDQEGLPVANAVVRFETTLGSINPSSVTTSLDGKVTAMYMTDKAMEIPNGKIDVVINADAEAVLGGKTVTDAQTRSVTVNTIPIIYPPEPPWLTIIVTVVVIVALVAVIIYLKRR